jgi:hypothetical protein
MTNLFGSELGQEPAERQDLQEIMSSDWLSYLIFQSVESAYEYVSGNWKLVLRIISK